MMIKSEAEQYWKEAMSMQREGGTPGADSSSVAVGVIKRYLEKKLPSEHPFHKTKYDWQGLYAALKSCPGQVSRKQFFDFYLEACQGMDNYLN